MSDFSAQSPTSSLWKICVENASADGTFAGAYLEMEKQ
jgi:hypothetical protein